MSRPFDELDDLAKNAFVDLHADTALHNLDLQNDGNPSARAQHFRQSVETLAIGFSTLKNFHRHIDQQTLAGETRGLQVFSVVTQGFPLFPQASFRSYAQLVAHWPRQAYTTPFNACLYQLSWLQKQLDQHPDLLIRARSFGQVLEAFRQNKIAVQVGLEGAFPLEVRQNDLQAFFALQESGHLNEKLQLPSEVELLDRDGRLHYLRQQGLVYASLSHLVSSCFSDSATLWGRRSTRGLHTEGVQLISSLQHHGVLVDLAHASVQAQRDVVRLIDSGRYRLPLIVSHGITTQQHFKLFRATPTDILHAIKTTQGVLGIMFARTYLRHGASSNTALVIDDICDHIDYLRTEVGIDCIALGSDADGFVGLPLPTKTESTRAILETLAQRGYTPEDLAKIRGGNYLHVLKKMDESRKTRSDS